jgi:hypothetical protein
MKSVYLKITKAKNAPWLVGCGAYGCGETVAEAKKVAEREVRSAYGPGVTTEILKVEDE